MRAGLDSLNQRNRNYETLSIAEVQPYVDFFTRYGTANDRVLAHYLLGRAYHDGGEAPKALEQYQKAAECADTSSADCDYHTMTAIYGQIADLFHLEFLPNDELRALQQVEQYAKLDKDTFSSIMAYKTATGKIRDRSAHTNMFQYSRRTAKGKTRKTRNYPKTTRRYK